jgi:GTP-binding protein
MPIQLEFVKSAVLVKDYPLSSGPEVAFAGRSNAGKSSLLNLIAGQKLAKVSQTPGKTRLLNFFQTKEKAFFVDMPGYGFAVRGNEEIKNWQSMVETYLDCRENLVGLMLVMDIRRDWCEEENMMLKFCQNFGIAFALILTKADKISRSATLQKQQMLQRQLSMSDVFVVSNEKKIGLDQIEGFLKSKWLVPKKNQLKR